MHTITVHASKVYPVVIDTALPPPAEWARYLRGDKVAIITDDNVDMLYPQVPESYLVGRECRRFAVPHGEESKSLQRYCDLLNALAQWQFNRTDTVVALGGGVVGDLAAFVASTYMRGVGLIAIPTSLLAMVDSSVGGKTAVNLSCGKNLCGTFYQPDAVFVATDFCRTLPAREVSCGWGEIIKYAFLSDTVTVDDLQGDVGEQLIAKCVQIKADIVARDEREGGLRKLLNWGHTVGHAIEALSGFTLSHGECVVKGMAAAVDISAAYYHLDDEVVARAKRILRVKGHSLDVPYTAQQIMAQLAVDKKSDATGTDMVLIDGALHAHIVHLDYGQIARLLV